MGLAQEFKEIFEGYNFHLVYNNNGVAEFKSDYVVVEDNVEIFFKIIVSLKDKFHLPEVVQIQDIYNSCEKIHEIAQYQHRPIKTHVLFNYTQNEKII